MHKPRRTLAMQTRGLPPRVWVERIPQAVADEVETGDGEGDEETGEDCYPRGVAEVALGVVEHVAPTRLRGLDAVAEVADVALGEDGVGDVEGGGDEDRGGAGSRSSASDDDGRGCRHRSTPS